MQQVAAAVIIEDNLLLLARRGPAEKLAGLWELPGGKLEPGESLKQCLERELLEELAMDSEAGRVLARTTYEYEHGCFQMLALSVTRLSSYTLTVHDCVRWVSKDDLRTLEIAPADIALVTELQRQGIW